MTEQGFDAVAYAIAYQFALAVGLGHTEAVRHATLAARAAGALAAASRAL